MGTDATIAMVYHDVMMSIVFNATTSGYPFVIRSNIDAMIELDPFGYRCDCPIGGAKQSIYVPLVLRYTSPEPRSHLEARARRLGKTGEDDAFGVDVPLATCGCTYRYDVASAYAHVVRMCAHAYARAGYSL